jgi:hypothetical protein
MDNLSALKAKKTVKESSHKDIADYAVNTLGKHTPPGFKKIQKQLNEDPVVQRIIAFSIKIHKFIQKLLFLHRYYQGC